MKYFHKSSNSFISFGKRKRVKCVCKNISFHFNLSHLIENFFKSFFSIKKKITLKVIACTMNCLQLTCLLLSNLKMKFVSLILEYICHNPI